MIVNQGDTIFGNQFYPTPEAMAARLLNGIKWQEITAALEPEAGKGDLAIYVRERIKASWGYHKQQSDTPDIDCIEIDPALQHILRGEELRVVHDDFLTFETWKRYSLIVMNPPFSEGDRHLLKALGMQRSGGMVRCILNAETLRNPYSNTRQDLARRLAELDAEIEYVQSGFIDAERSTPVEVAIIRVDIPSIDAPSIILDAMKREREAEETVTGFQSEIVDADPVRAMIESYNFEAKAGLALINEWRRLRPFVMDRVADQYRKPLLTLVLGEKSIHGDDASANGYIRMLRRKYWTGLFANDAFTGMLTTDLRKSYMAQVETLVDFEFSHFNIWTIRAQFNGEVLQGIDKAIIDLFDQLSHKYHWCDETSKNIHYYSGWKTNTSWKINRRVIVPMRAIERSYSGKIQMGYSSQARETLSDIERVFCYLDGQPISNSNTVQIIAALVDQGRTSGIETPYFKVTFYLKGTCHITFYNERLLKKFNIYGSRHKKWLPPTYGHATYRDMGADERAVVDEFEGEASYADTLARSKFFLAGPEQMLAATSTTLALPMPSEVAA